MKGTPRSFLGKIFSSSSEKHYSEEKSHDGFSWRKFGRHYRKAFLWIVILTALVHIMEVSGVLKGFEMAGLDTFLRIHGREMSKQVVIVEITNEDYKNPDLFSGKSPLKSEQLVSLVSKVQDYKPAVIGMDFDTESEDWCRLDSAALAKILPQEPNSQRAAARAPVVWAEVPDNIEEPLKLAPVLGGRLRDSTYTGIPRFPVDSDGLVRRYEGEFRVTGTLGNCPAKPGASPEKGAQAPKGPDVSEALDVPSTLPSFARAVIEHACKDNKVGCSFLQEGRKRPVIFNFYGDRYRFPIIQSHEFIGADAETSLRDEKLQSKRRDLLKDKIVLVGGSFNAARDVYMTPLGQMAGVELIALAVQSDFGGGIRETQKVLEILADIFIGSIIVLVYFYYRRRPRFAFVASLAGVPAIAILFSFILFRTAAYWFDFMPIIIGMVMHQMLELSESCGELQKEVRKLERKISEFHVSRH